MASYDYGKDKVMDRLLRWASKRDFYDSLRFLDVGACDGKWARLIYQTTNRAVREGSKLGNDLPEIRLDAVEIFKPNAARILDLYDNVFVGSIADYGYKFHQYDIIIFGDVIEHMEVNEAQYVLDYARGNCGADIIVGVPFQYKQGPLYGNPWERHIQDDLTPELMAERYPGLELMFQAAPDYAYYHKKGGEL